MKQAGWWISRWVAILALWTCWASAADFGNPGGPPPANLMQISDVLRQEPYDLELLISFGTSKGGSAGHIAVAIRDAAAGNDDLVYSANFYADRDPKHAGVYYTSALMLGIPKREYLFGTTSTLAPTAVFGLDFGEIYKRSVMGVRVSAVPDGDKAGLVAGLTGYFARMNDDYRGRARNTEYHRGEIKYDYLRLNCAKTIGSAFKYGAGYRDLDVTSARLMPGSRVVAAARANTPTEMAVKLIEQWAQRGYRMDVVLYKKYADSAYVDPREEEPIAFKDLPNRFPSVLSLDFNREQGAYRDFDNLYAMYLLYNLGRYSVRVNAQTHLLEIEKTKEPMAYRPAAALATQRARADSENTGSPPDNTHLYDFSDEVNDDGGDDVSAGRPATQR